MVAAAARRRCPWVVTCVLVRDDVATKRGYSSCVWVVTWQRDVFAQPKNTCVCVRGGSTATKRLWDIEPGWGVEL